MKGVDVDQFFYEPGSGAAMVLLLRRALTT